MSKSTTREIIDRIFKEPGIKYELTEFETLGKPIHEILDIQAKTVDTGRRDIQESCPHVGIDPIRKILREWKQSGKLECLGRGPNTRWRNR